MAGIAQCVSAQAYPNRPIHVIVPYGPGSAMDIMGRIVSTRLHEALGQPAVVDNRAGAGGNIGTTAAARATPDGYTIALGALGPVVQNPVLYSNVTFDPVKDFAGVTLIATGPIVLAMHPSIPVKNVKELVELARKKPGQLSYGSGGIGSATHIAGELFKLVTKTDILHVPYKGNVESITDMIGGQVSMVYSGAPPVMELAKTGKVRVMVTTGRKRMAGLPDVPTIAEAGFPDAEMVIWYGFIVPAATPKNIIATLNTAIVKLVKTPEVREQLIVQGVDPETNTPEQFAQLIRDDYARWTKIIRAAKIKME